MLKKILQINSQPEFQIIRFNNLYKVCNFDDITTNHKTNLYSLIFITDNVGRHSIDYTDYFYTKGTILAIRKDQINKFYFNKNVKGYLLYFKEDFLNNYLNEIEVANTMQMFNELIISPKTHIDENNFTHVLNIILGIENELLNVNDNYSNKLIRSLMHIFFTLIHRAKSKDINEIKRNKYLNEFIKFQNLLEQEYCKTKKVLDYANKLGFSTKKLNTIVNIVANKPAKEFIDDTVIVKIKSMLINSNLSIKEIAFKTGFMDPTNFYKYFKKHTDFTPEEFRKK